MKRAHDWHSERSQDLGRYPAPGSGGALTRLRPQPLRRTQRGYSIIELAVSLGIFLVLATVITIAVARSLGAATTVRVERAAEAAMSSQLAKLSSVPYDRLLKADFTVPDPCAGTPAGIGGESCVKHGNATIRISYQFQDLNATSATATACADVARPTRVSTTFGYVGLCASVESVNGTALSSSDLALSTATKVTAPSPKYAPEAGVVRAKLTGQWSNVAGSSVFLVKTADPAIQVASAQVVSDTVFLSVPAGAATPANQTCTDASPCMLALNPGPRPTTSNGVALFGSTATGPAAAVTAAAGTITEVTADVVKVGTARLDLLATNGSLAGSNPVGGSVCLWATFVDAGARRTVPACNTTSAPDRVMLDFYDPQWDSASAGTTRYPYPPGVPVTVTVDHPDGVCYRAPGMVGSVPGAPAAAGRPTGWADRAVCTSFTWGVPTGLESTVTLPENGGQVQRAVTWAESPTGAALPAAGAAGAGEVWAKPRQAPGCSTDATCRTVVDVPMESLECDAATVHCFSGENREPAVADPGTRLVRNDTAGLSAPFAVRVNDPEGDTVTVKAAGRALGTGTLTWSSTETGTYAALPASGATLSTTAGGAATLWFRYDRAAGDTALRTFDLQLSDNVGTGSRTETLGLYYADEPWKVTGPDVTIAQGGSASITAVLSSTSGAAAAGQTLTFSTGSTGLTFAPAASATTGADGTATLTLTAGAAPAGTHTVTVTAANGRTGTIRVTVTAAAGSLTVTATGGTQGSTHPITVQARDRAAAPLAGVVVTLSATATGSTDPSNTVYPRQAGCVTDGAGTCTTDLVIEDTATAGAYTVRALSGSYTTSTPVTVTAAPGELRTDPAAAAVAAQGDTAAPLALTLVDRAGAPMPTTQVTLTGITGLTPSPATVTTNSAGVLSSTLAVAATKSAGTYTLTGTVGAFGPLPFKVAVRVSAANLTYAPVSVAQGSTAVIDVNVTDTSGAPAPGTLVRFSAADATALTVDGRAVTDAAGNARVTVAATDAAHAGEYTVSATVGDIPFAIRVTVTPTPRTITLTGVVEQGETQQPFTATVLDATGDPVPSVPVTVAWGAPKLTATPASGTTTAEGVFAFTTSDTGPTKAGTYTLTVTAGALRVDAAVPVTARAASVVLSPAALELTTSTTRTATVTVTDRAGDPLPGAQVVADAGDSDVAVTPGGATSAAGTTTLTLAAGRTVTGRQEHMQVGTTAGDVYATVPLSVLPPGTYAHSTASPSGLWPLDSVPDSETGPVTGTVYDTTFTRPGTLTSPGPATGTGYANGSRFAQFQAVPASGAVTTATSLSVPDPSSNLLPATGSFTVSGWVRPQSLVYPRTGFAVSKGSLGGAAKGPGFAIGEGSASTTLQVELADGTNYVTGSVALPAGSRVTDWVGKWTQVTVVFDRAGGTALVYVNGAYAGSTPIGAVTGSVAAPSPLLVGNNSGWRMDGGVDDLAVYPRALTGGQVWALYNTRLDPYTASVLSTHPQSYYKLGESAGGATDSAQAHLDATATPDVTTLNSKWARGAAGLVPGTDGSATVPGAAAGTAGLRVNNDARHQGTDFSLSFWARPNNTDSTTWRSPAFARNNTATNFYGWNVYVGPTSNGSRPANEWQFWTGTGGASWNVLYTGLSAEPGKTVHVTVTRTGGTGRFYLDGVLVGQAPMTMAASTAPLFLGTAGSSYQWAGGLDEVAVYDRALSDAEIRRLSADGRP